METMTAAEHRAKAEQAYDRAEESWQRSDTDGFLSQWASGITGDLHRAQADLLDNGGKSTFAGLCRHDGAELGDCNCRACERAGYPKRIATTAAIARSKFTRGLMDEFGNLEALKAAHPDWWIEANAVTRKAANAEALAVLAELERVSA